MGSEKVQIPYDKPCIFLEGEGQHVTTITYNDHRRTDTSATFSSFPNNVVAAGITFKVRLNHFIVKQNTYIQKIQEHYLSNKSEQPKKL